MEFDVRWLETKIDHAREGLATCRSSHSGSFRDQQLRTFGDEVHSSQCIKYGVRRSHDTSHGHQDHAYGGAGFDFASLRFASHAMVLKNESREDGTRKKDGREEDEMD